MKTTTFTIRTKRALLWPTATACAWLALPAAAATVPENFIDLDLATLMEMEVTITSVSKREAKLSEAAAAVTVITDEYIRRSGLSTLPEVLRLVPGLNVARIDANNWAISSRGFTNQFANKLLVLMDGRTLYTPSSAGVYWNAQDVMLEDIDRIEVIRGPGATLWGANAVNGVINISTKSAKATQGLLVQTAFGTEEQPIVAIRYGGALTPELHYRAYMKYSDREGLVDSAGEDAPDDWSSKRGGLSADWEPSSANSLSFKAEYHETDARKPCGRAA